jgi:hypothetical protein
MTLPKPGLLAYSLGANVVLLALAIWLGWMLAGAKPKCEAKQLGAVVSANGQQAKDTAKRDHTLDGVTEKAKTSTGKALAKAEDHTNARASAIDAVHADGGCRAPAGLPDLRPAVDEANAAAGD